MRGIYAAKKVGMKVKINSVALKNINDNEILNLVNWCGENKFSLTFIEVMPMGEIGEKRFNQFMPLTEVKNLIQTKYSIVNDSMKTSINFCACILSARHFQYLLITFIFILSL